MKKTKHKKSSVPEMLPEYDFTGKTGTRGKYYQAYRQGHSVRVTQADGSIEMQYFTLQDGAVMLEPDVREYFPNSEAVNRALRSLIALVPSKPRQTKNSRTTPLKR
jgi:hypothetical protein